MHYLSQTSLRQVYSTFIYQTDKNIHQQYLKMIFPQYRKLNDKAYYKIVSETEMFEYQKLGKRYIQFHIIAQTFVDRNLISDVLSGDNGRYDVASKNEYESVAKSSDEASNC
jgi:hypothetical protein